MITRRKMMPPCQVSRSRATAVGTAFRAGHFITRGKSTTPRKAFCAAISRASYGFGKQAGLTHPIIYGGVDSKSYIVEVVGCGVAFIDYDNDGWVDLFVLSALVWKSTGRHNQSPIQK